MKGIKTGARAAGMGLLCSIAAMLLSVWAIRSLGSAAGALGGIMGENAAQQFSAILGQLRGAEVLPPLWPALAAGAVIGWAWMKNGRRIAAKAIVLTALLTVLCICLAQVNGIRLWTAAGIVLKLVQAGAF